MTDTEKTCAGSCSNCSCDPDGEKVYTEKEFRVARKEAIRLSFQAAINEISYSIDVENPDWKLWNQALETAVRTCESYRDCVGMMQPLEWGFDEGD